MPRSRWLIGLLVVAGVLVLVAVLVLVLRPLPETEPEPEPTVTPAPTDVRGETASPPVATERPEASDEQALTWAPPDTDGFTAVTVEAPGTIRLEDDRDYVIEAPDVIEGAVTLRGGRNIVWIGGHIRIPHQGPYADTASRRALVIDDGQQPVDGRIVHIEGLLIDGEDLSEGINTNSPSAIVQIQNCRVGPVAFREVSDREGSESYPSANHPDIIQTWGSVKELRVDGLTGLSAYQGIFLKADQNQPHGPTYLRRVDLQGVEHIGVNEESFYGQRLLWWDPRFSGRLFLDTGTVYLDHHPQSEWGPDFGDNVHPPSDASGQYRARVAVDEDGRYLYWERHGQATSDGGNADGGNADAVVAEDHAVLDWEGSRPGRVYAGAPPVGDYVPEQMVGTTYRSPGYGHDKPPAGGG